MLIMILTIASQTVWIATGFAWRQWSIVCAWGGEGMLRQPFSAC
jgi:hypothetical protein